MLIRQQQHRTECLFLHWHILIRKFGRWESGGFSMISGSGMVIGTSRDKPILIEKLLNPWQAHDTKSHGTEFVRPNVVSPSFSNPWKRISTLQWQRFQELANTFTLQTLQIYCCYLVGSSMDLGRWLETCLYKYSWHQHGRYYCSIENTLSWRFVWNVLAYPIMGTCTATETYLKARRLIITNLLYLRIREATRQFEHPQFTVAYFQR